MVGVVRSGLKGFERPLDWNRKSYADRLKS